MICFLSILHVGGHIYNYNRFVDVNKEHNTLAAALKNLYLQSTNSILNPITNYQVVNVGEMLRTTAGITGVILSVCLILMFSSSTMLMRRSFYELFWFTHHLFIVFFICLAVHGIQGLIKSQTNVKQHDPVVCAPIYTSWTNSQCPVFPTFSGSSSTSWIWLLIPVVLYIIERIIRLVRSLQHVEIQQVTKHASNVFEIRFKKSNMKPLPGQYIYIKCFAIAKLEWHPFTVTSSPEEDFISVHIRSCGNWTKQLAERLKNYPQDIPNISVDGPYGAPADDCFNYDSVILVGAGIGVTPYAAILKHIRSIQTPNARLVRVYFYWICNTTDAFEWFGDLLQQLEHEINRPNFLIYKIFLTKWSLNEAKAVVRNHDDTRDLWTGLQQKTYYGRPNFDQDFSLIKDESQQNSDIGVFVCGPKQLANQLQRLCIKHNRNEKNINFYLNKENF
ncbi:unnamed protein product [Didymodactylos carnosus]|uniref:FAD-binding FR-type domain-containing protein n=1 Tax=Didymodactylos carnosus TaxID=1234261 RepID=A0A814QVA6_9BILA|nr:unnamed protein product [Didymodactylos carnosus]CAF1124667.1 unnamed protein product [Didymodactylos carnosus]CAF3714649.1 unnamed protein product [Didymodactylos carnosus]CAF3888158.1 unnamed protein product [Didymodactylos carnosus]